MGGSLVASPRLTVASATGVFTVNLAGAAPTARLPITAHVTKETHHLEQPVDALAQRQPTEPRTPISPTLNQRDDRAAPGRTYSSLSGDDRACVCLAHFQDHSSLAPDVISLGRDPTTEVRLERTAEARSPCIASSSESVPAAAKLSAKPNGAPVSPKGLGRADRVGGAAAPLVSRRSGLPGWEAWPPRGLLWSPCRSPRALRVASPGSVSARGVVAERLAGCGNLMGFGQWIDSIIE
ncbi:hypothetical protein B2J93_9242 [Marssonina coronariae]|uniref:Uncharacterized protein n=1 Tax=Diplocarpon coronariae TaxID=2795749 RepID=A0A218ZEG8_9HELO|nr:hypothetical protein B2J93_9242 [Marssonina coronariae]